MKRVSLLNQKKKRLSLVESLPAIGRIFEKQEDATAARCLTASRVLRSPFRLTLVQIPTFDLKTGLCLKSFEKLLKSIPETHCVVFPEMWLSGFEMDRADYLWQQTQIALKCLRQFAKERRCYVIGSHVEKESKGYSNTASVIAPSGRITARYPKIHLFQPGREHEKFVAGNQAVVVPTPFGKIGLAICYDLRFPELMRKLVLSGADLLIVPAAWPLLRIDHYLTLLKARAIENLCFVVGVNKSGTNAEGIVYGGNSVIYHPWGQALLQLGEQQEIQSLAIDLNEVQKIRREFPVFEARREEAY